MLKSNSNFKLEVTDVRVNRQENWNDTSVIKLLEKILYKKKYMVLTLFEKQKAIGFIAGFSLINIWT